MKKILFILLFGLVAMVGYSQNTNSDITRNTVNARIELNVRDSTIMEVISANSEDSSEVDTAIKTQIAEYAAGDTLTADTVSYAYVAGTSLDSIFGGITVGGDVGQRTEIESDYGVRVFANNITNTYSRLGAGTIDLITTGKEFSTSILADSIYYLFSNSTDNQNQTILVQYDGGFIFRNHYIFGGADKELFRIDTTGKVSITKKATLYQTSATTTDGDLLYETNQDKLYGYSNGIAGWYDKAIFSQYAAVTRTGVVSAVSLIDNTNKVGTTTLPANFFKQGKALRYRLVGYYTTDASPGNATVTINIGGTTFRTTGSFALDNSVTNGYWQIEGAITCYTTGVTGTLAGMISWNHVITDGAGFPMHHQPTTTVTPVTFNTTQAGQFDVLWTADDAGTSITTTTVRLWEIF